MYCPRAPERRKFFVDFPARHVDHQAQMETHFEAALPCGWIAFRGLSHRPPSCTPFTSSSTSRSRAVPRSSLPRMTPRWSITYTVGQPMTFQRVAIGPSLLPPSHQLRQVICSFAMTLLSSSRPVSLLMPTRANGLPSRRLTSDRSCGYMPRQGGHQCPQKCSTTTLPL